MSKVRLIVVTIPRLNQQLKEFGFKKNPVPPVRARNQIEDGYPEYVKYFEAENSRQALASMDQFMKSNLYRIFGEDAFVGETKLGSKYIAKYYCEGYQDLYRKINT